MTTQPEALRLADEIAAMLPTYVTEPVAAELRRLHAQRDALLEALKKIAFIEDQMYGNDWEEIEEARVIARAAIAKAEGEKI